MLTYTAPSQYYFWEAVDLARRIALTGALLMIKDERILRRLYVALLTSLVWLTFLMATFPFKRLQFDLLSIASSFTLVCVYFWAMLVKLHNDAHAILGAYVGARLTLDDIDHIVLTALSFRKPSSIVFVMILFTFSVLFIVIGALGQQLLAAQRVRTFRAANGDCPELTLHTGHIWHLFLSHGLCARLDAVASLVGASRISPCALASPRPPQSGAAGRTRWRWSSGSCCCCSPGFASSSTSTT